MPTYFLSSPMWVYRKHDKNKINHKKVTKSSLLKKIYTHLSLLKNIASFKKVSNQNHSSYLIQERDTVSKIVEKKRGRLYQRGVCNRKKDRFFSRKLETLHNKMDAPVRYGFRVPFTLQGQVAPSAAA